MRVITKSAQIFQTRVTANGRKAVREAASVNLVTPGRRDGTPFVANGQIHVKTSMNANLFSAADSLSVLTCPINSGVNVPMVGNTAVIILCVQMWTSVLNLRSWEFSVVDYPNVSTISTPTLVSVQKVGTKEARIDFAKM